MARDPRGLAQGKREPAGPGAARSSDREVRRARKEAFERGLAHVVAQTVRFDAHAAASVKEALTRGRGVKNLYRFEPWEPVPQEEVERVVAATLVQAASPFDSHPPPGQRIAWAKRTGALGAPSACPDGDAWTLFDDREALELRMTELVRRRIKRSRGVDIARDVSEGMARGTAA